MKNQKMTFKPHEKPSFYLVLHQGNNATPNYIKYKTYDAAQEEAISIANANVTPVYILQPILKIDPEVMLHFTNIDSDLNDPTEVPDYEIHSIGQGTNL